MGKKYDQPNYFLFLFFVFIYIKQKCLIFFRGGIYNYKSSSLLGSRELFSERYDIVAVGSPINTSNGTVYTSFVKAAPGIAG